MCTALGDTRGGELAKSKSNHTRRAATASANRPRGRLLGFLDPLRSGRLIHIEDRRQFHPGVPSPRTIRQVARISMRPAKRPFRKSSAPRLYKPEVWAFQVPRSTAICVRRSIRKQVIHAKGVAGRKVARPKRNRFSAVSCRRK